MILKDTHIFIPSGELPEKIKIGNRYYKTRDILHVIEQILKIRIICKYENRAVRNMQNVSLRVPIELNTNNWDALKIIGKNEIYLLTPSVK